LNESQQRNGLYYEWHPDSHWYKVENYIRGHLHGSNTFENDNLLIRKYGLPFVVFRAMDLANAEAKEIVFKDDKAKREGKRIQSITKDALHFMLNVAMEHQIPIAPHFIDEMKQTAVENVSHPICVADVLYGHDVLTLFERNG
jgi:hypothetical protein